MGGKIIIKKRNSCSLFGNVMPFRAMCIYIYIEISQLYLDNHCYIYIYIFFYILISPEVTESSGFNKLHQSCEMRTVVHVEYFTEWDVQCRVSHGWCWIEIDTYRRIAGKIQDA